MKRVTAIATVLGVAGVFCAPHVGAAEGKFDGSSVIICTALVVHECAVGEYCQPRTAESVGLPSLLRVDTGAKKISNLAPGNVLQSIIKSSDNVNGRLVLYGGEEGRGWAVSINEQTGRLSGAVAGDGEGFIIFGQCALP